jgi:hypothetical protein
MKNLIIVLFLGLSFMSWAQKTETRSLSSFSGVKAAEGIDVYLKKGSKESVRLEVSGVELSDVITEVSGDYLKIHMREGRYRDKTVKVYVTYVKVTKLSASSAANIFSNEVLQVKELSLNASSAASIDVEIDAEKVSAGASSAADIELKGKAGELEAQASSAGEISAYDLVAESVDASASSAGSIKISVTKGISAQASSGGSVRYRGNPERSNTHSSSGGSVKKAN